MQSNDSFVKIKSCDASIPYNFYVSKFPVFADPNRVDRASQNLMGLALCKATWIEAIQFCNLLSVKNNLPAAYDDQSGDFLHRSGFRLPTPIEWEYAAKGWSEVRSGEYLQIQRQQYKIPEIDFPITQKQINLYDKGYSYSEDLIENELGVCGMLVYAKEWCHSLRGCNDGKNTYIHWEEYIVNYDNAIGYKTIVQKACADERYAFRVVLSE